MALFAVQRLNVSKEKEAAPGTQRGTNDKRDFQCRRGRSGALRVKLSEESRQWQLSVEQMLKMCPFFAILPPLPCDSTLRDSSLCSVHQSIGQKGVWDVSAVERFLWPEKIKARPLVSFRLFCKSQPPHPLQFYRDFVLSSREERVYSASQFRSCFCQQEHEHKRKGETMRIWLVFREQLEGMAYRGLTSAEKVYLDYVVASFSEREEPFYASDARVAATIGLSTSKIRSARRKIGWSTRGRQILVSWPFFRVSVERPQGKGVFVFTPGWKVGGKSLATKYVAIVPPSDISDPTKFAQISVDTFQRLLQKVRTGELTHTDVVVWVVLAYFHDLHKQEQQEQEEEQPFAVKKADIGKFAQVSGISTHVRRLAQQITDCGGHLFQVADQGQCFLISQWRDSDFDEKWQREAEEEIQAKMTPAATKHNRSGNISRLGGKDELGDD
jgi:hypothetical protein